MLVISIDVALRYTRTLLGFISLWCCECLTITRRFLHFSFLPAKRAMVLRRKWPLMTRRLRCLSLICFVSFFSERNILSVFSIPVTEAAYARAARQSRGLHSRQRDRRWKFWSFIEPHKITSPAAFSHWVSFANWVGIILLSCRHRHRRTEQEEDEELLSETKKGGSATITRFDMTPWCMFSSL